MKKQQLKAKDFLKMKSLFSSNLKKKKSKRNKTVRALNFFVMRISAVKINNNNKKTLSKDLCILGQ